MCKRKSEIWGKYFLLQYADKLQNWKRYKFFYHVVSDIELRPGWIPEGYKNGFQLIQTNEVIESKRWLSSLMWISMESGEYVSLIGEMEAFTCAENKEIWYGNPSWCGKASSEWMKCLPFPSPAPAWFTPTLPCSPLALHPTPHGSSSLLLLILTTPVSIQASHPNPSHQTSSTFSSQLPAPFPAPGSLPSQSQFPPKSWILFQDTPISPPVDQWPAPCPLIPIHII